MNPDRPSSKTNIQIPAVLTLSNIGRILAFNVICPMCRSVVMEVQAKLSGDLISTPPYRRAERSS
jgi:hypothetical protein